MSTENYQVPFQVQNIIDSLLNKKENIHLRGNYRMRLDSIKRSIDEAMTKYDRELILEGNKKGKR